MHILDLFQMAMIYFEMETLILSQLARGDELFTYGHYPEITKSDDFKKNDHCECYDIEDYEIEFECRCGSENLTGIPTNLGNNLTRLTFSDSRIKFITKYSLDPYRQTLKDITFSNLQLLEYIEEETFANIPNLRTIYITIAPKLQFAHGLLRYVSSIKFYSLRIVHTGLKQVPDFSYLSSENVMHLLDLDRNQLEQLPANSFNVRSEQVTLNFNKISIVKNFAFNGSEIGSLNLRGNIRLKKLELDAFKGMKSLRELDLSGTSIDSLPHNNLKELETLRIENTPTMKVIPSIYDLESLKEASLTHSFHCCAFKFPKRHNPSRYEEITEKLKHYCKSNENSKLMVKKIRKKRLTFTGNSNSENAIANKFATEKNITRIKKWKNVKRFSNGKDKIYENPQRGEKIEHEEAKPVETEDEFGIFHEASTDLSDSIYRVFLFCGNLSVRTPVIKCYPEPNALNPCEDIMGYSWLRISVWFVVVLTIVGNSTVIVVIIFGKGNLTVTRFLICNLVTADLSMGLYLLFIAFMDLRSVGSYFNHAFDWQYGLGCKLAGVLTVFASQLSVFTLTVITMERWFAITYAIHLTKRIQIGRAAKIMIAGWIYSIILAILPLTGVNNYSSTSICLPMETNKFLDKAYITFIIMVNGIAFGLIVYCYAKIYLSLGQETRRYCSVGEMSIAKKMALLVFTDFVTFAPIALFSLTALAGYPLMGVSESKILLVFFYPLNSCANPYLYVITTAQFRTEFIKIFDRCKLKTEKRNNNTSSGVQLQDVKKSSFLLSVKDCEHSDSKNVFNNDVNV